VRPRGFTLLEVLIALAVLAVSAAAVLRQTQLGIHQQQLLELKTAAMWIADDTIATLTTQPQWPPVGRTEREVTVQEQRWNVATDVQTTSEATLRRIVVSVSRADSGNQDSPLVTFTTYRGQY
jgi:general secretion pathway protein I